MTYEYASSVLCILGILVAGQWTRPYLLENLLRLDQIIPSPLQSEPTVHHVRRLKAIQAGYGCWFGVGNFLSPRLSFVYEWKAIGGLSSGLWIVILCTIASRNMRTILFKGLASLKRVTK